jgi:hypothetical protein
VNDGTTAGFLGGGRGRMRAILVGALVLALTVGAMLWPGSNPSPNRGIFVVFDSSGNTARQAAVYQPLADYLDEFAGQPLDLQVVSTLDAFRDKVAAGALFALCPDGLALNLDTEKFVPLVVGRRAAPRNLRPRGVLVFRKTAGFVPSPWISRAAATVCGDSVSLTATGAWRRNGDQSLPGPRTPLSCAWGPDPYDHAPALHAARLGGFDYALVRQWDADRFFSSGLLSPLEWGVEILTIPVPDIVLFAAREIPGRKRLEVGDGLAALGRGGEEQSPLARDLQRGIAGLNLVGFNLLVDPDFDLVRRNFVGNWPPARD